MYKSCCVVFGMALFPPLWALAQPSAVPAGFTMASSARVESTQAGVTGVDRPTSVTLASMRDVSRPVLVFAETDADERFLQQVRWFAAGAHDASERQVVFLPVVRRRDARSWGVDLSVGHLGPEEMTAARERFHVAPSEFAVILVGKDGGEKYRSRVPVTIEKLDALIDAMPMRQQEVLDGHHPK